jgi:3-hydroxyacyl-CoA dehydrogenase
MSLSHVFYFLAGVAQYCPPEAIISTNSLRLDVSTMVEKARKPSVSHPSKQHI